MNDGLIMFGALFVAIALGLPIPIAVVAASVLGVYLIDLPYVFITQSMYDALQGIPLMTIPMFVLAGAIMERGGMAFRLVGVAQAMVGRQRGSLGIVAIVGCTFFAALSGSGPATTAAVGGVILPSMMKEGYSKPFAGAVFASGGALGSLIPPSNLMIFYGIVSDTSIPRLFLAGIIPGLLASGLLMFVAWLIATRRGYGGGADPFSWGTFRTTLWDAKWALVAPLIILGGIYAGIFTATEAAAVAVVYSLFVGLFVYKELSWSDLGWCFKTTALLSGTVIIILGPAKAFGQLVSLMKIPDAIGLAMSGLTDSTFLTLMIIVLILIISGMFLESIAQIILFTPLFLPIVIPLGIDPVAFGILLVVACEIGFLTPPVGANLFVASRLTGVSIERLSVSVLPFLFAYVAVIVILALFPQLSTWIPNMAYGVSGSY